MHQGEQLVGLPPLRALAAATAAAAAVRTHKRSISTRWWCWPPARPRPPGCLRCLPTRPWPMNVWPRLWRAFFRCVVIVPAGRGSGRVRARGWRQRGARVNAARSREAGAFEGGAEVQSGQQAARPRGCSTPPAPQLAVGRAAARRRRDGVPRAAPAACGAAAAWGESEGAARPSPTQGNAGPGQRAHLLPTAKKETDNTTVASAGPAAAAAARKRRAIV